jgi:hypothetical protein
MFTTNQVMNYKEAFIRNANRGEFQVYYFEYSEDIKGFYVIEKGNKIYLSVCAISSILPENVYEKLFSKYFDINDDIQKQCFLIKKENNFDNLQSKYQGLLNIILQNSKKGTPRKFIISEGERINVQLDIDNLEGSFFTNY